MAWTTPKTYTPVVLNASELNTYQRDNFLIVKKSLDDLGNLAPPTSVLTISSGSITVVNNIHTVATEGLAATDDLTDIVLGTDTRAGMIVILSANDSGDTVVVKHGTGSNKISLAGGRDLSLDESWKQIALIRRGTQWYELEQRGPVFITPVQALDVTASPAFSGPAWEAAFASLDLTTYGLPIGASAALISVATRDTNAVVWEVRKGGTTEQAYGGTGVDNTGAGAITLAGQQVWLPVSATGTIEYRYGHRNGASYAPGIEIWLHGYIL